MSARRTNGTRANGKVAEQAVDGLQRTANRLEGSIPPILREIEVTAKQAQLIAIVSKDVHDLEEELREAKVRQNLLLAGILSGYGVEEGRVTRIQGTKLFVETVDG